MGAEAKDFEEVLEDLVCEEEQAIPPDLICMHFLVSTDEDRRVEEHSAELLRRAEGKQWRKYLHFTSKFGGEVICEELQDFANEIAATPEDATMWSPLKITPKAKQAIRSRIERFRKDPGLRAVSVELERTFGGAAT